MADRDALYRLTIELQTETRLQRAEIARLHSAIVHLAISMSSHKSIQDHATRRLQSKLTPPCVGQAHPAASPTFNAHDQVGVHVNHQAPIPNALRAVGQPTPPASVHHCMSYSGSSLLIEDGSDAETKDGKYLGQSPQGDLLGLDAAESVADFMALAPTTSVASDGDPIRITHSDGDYSIITVRPPPAPKLDRLRFYEYERKRIIGFATWIEEWAEEEVLEGWEEFGRVNPSHTAAEWQSYYETVIRPDLVEKGQIAEKQSTSHGSLSSDVTTGESQGNVNLSDMTLPNMQLAKSPDLEAGQDLLSWLSPSSKESEKLVVAAVDPKSQDKIAMMNDGVLEPESLLQIDNAGSLTTLDKSPQFLVSHSPISVRNAEHAEEIRVTNVLIEDSSECNISETTSHGLTMRGEPTNMVARNTSSFGEATGDQATASSIPITVCINPAVLPSAHVKPLRQGPFGRSYGYDGVRGRREQGKTYNDFRRDTPGACSPETWPAQDQEVRRNLFSTDKSLCHTVMISGIRPGTTLLEILNQVRGGQIVSATYLDLSARFRHAKTDSAMIVFFTAARASAYVDFCAKNAIDIKADLITSPTFSCPFKRYRTFTPWQITAMDSRVLFLHHPSSDMTAQQALYELVQIDPRFAQLSSQSLAVHRDETGMILMEFANVLDARAARWAVNGRQTIFWDFKKGFAMDPCEKPLSELVGNVGVDEGEIEQEEWWVPSAHMGELSREKGAKESYHSDVTDMKLRDKDRQLPGLTEPETQGE